MEGQLPGSIRSRFGGISPGLSGPWRNGFTYRRGIFETVRDVARTHSITAVLGVFCNRSIYGRDVFSPISGEVPLSVRRYTAWNQGRSVSISVLLPSGISSGTGFPVVSLFGSA